MINSLNDLLRVQQSALDVRAKRQEILSSNIANADTPGFKARDIDFQSALKETISGSRGGAGAPQAVVMARTDPGHMAGVAQAGSDPQLLYRTEHQSSVDGNTVDMDTERAQFAQNTLNYEAALTFVNNMINGVRSAITG